MTSGNVGGLPLAVWVKICGITRAEDARAAFEAGADAIGLNFVGGPRKVTVATARTILEGVPRERGVVALVTLDPDGLEASVHQLLAEHAVRHLQMYGDVSPKNVGHLVDRGYQPVPVCRVREGELVGSLKASVAGLDADDLFAIVLDAHALDQRGGTGKTIDWEALARARDRGELRGYPPVILAGGLTPQNVDRAIQIVRPWGVDVSSGVESSPGRKDHQALLDFVRAAKGVA